VGLTVTEIRDRAERFGSAVIEEIYEARAGRKSWPELAPLYEGQTILSFDETIPVIERDLASSEGEDERRLRRLRQWVAEHHLRAANARLDDEYAYWVNTATVHVDGLDLPVSQAGAVMAATEARAGRRELAEARYGILDEGVPLQLDRLSRWRAAAAELGYGDIRRATERLAGINLEGLLHEARRVVDETEDEYRENLRYQLHSRLHLAPESAEAHDADWLERMKWLDGSSDEGSILDLVTRDLRDIGLPLPIGGRVALEHESFPGPGMRACCAPIQVPRRVALLVTPTVTQPGCTSLLTEIGKTLHYAYTDAHLPFEYRSLGDLSVVHAHAALFAGLSRSRPWTRRVHDMEAGDLDDHLRLAVLIDLYALRRLVAQLEFDLELSDSDRPAALGPRWAELLHAATGFHFDPRAFLERLGQRFGAARLLRGRMLAAQLHRELRERFDDDWYRNPRAGPFLGDWLAEGLRFSAVELATQLGEDRLNADALLSSIREGLA
jgi:hypothetical protein